MALAKVENNLACLSPSSDMEYNWEALKARNKELNIDVSILKRLVYMLNVELELRDLHTGKKNDTGLSNELEHNFSSIKSDRILHWNHEDITMIDPLLRAFQQMKEEKDQLIANYKRVFDDLSGHCKEIILENDTLREQLQETKAKAESTYVEWKKLHREYLLIKEHNQLLTRQAKLFQNKILSIESVYRTSIKQFENERHELNEKFESTKTELLLLKGRFSVMTQVTDQIKNQNDERNDVNFYNVISKELKDLSVELKLHNAKDIDSLKRKITHLEEEKYDLDIQLVKLSTERDHLKGYISAVEMEARKLNSRYEELEKELYNAKISQGDAKKQIVKCMAFIRELVGVHNVLLNQVNETDDIPDYEDVS